MQQTTRAAREVRPALRRRLALAILLLATPLAQAASVTGEVAVGRHLALPAGAELSGVAVGIYTELEQEGALVLDASAPTARVQLVEMSYAAASVGPLRPAVMTSDARPTWIAEDVDLRLAPARRGFVGMTPHDATVSVSSSEGLTIAQSMDPKLGNAEFAPDPDRPGFPFYEAGIEGAGLRYSTVSWSLEGTTLMRVLGPTIVIVSRTNTTTIETGEVPDPSTPGRIVRRWAIIELRDATIDARAPRWDILAREMQADWTGSTRLEGAEGTLGGGATEWIATGGDERIDGAFTATIRPRQDGIDLALSGDMRTSTMRTRLATPTGAGDWMLPMALIAVVAAATGGGYALARRRRQPGTTTIGPEDYAHLAEIAADADDFERAASLAEQARKESPTSRRLVLDHAYYLHRAGQREKAKGVLAAPTLATDADALMLLAHVHHSLGEDADAATALTRALRIAPALCLDLDGDPHLEALLARSDVASAMRDARRELR